jgi:hypothetical protein
VRIFPLSDLIDLLNVGYVHGYWTVML